MDRGQPLENILTSELVIATDRDQKEKLLHSSPVFHVNGEATDAHRETDILDDEDNHIPAAIVSDCKESGHARPALQSIPSSGNCRNSSQSTDATDGIYSSSRQILTHHLVSSGYPTPIWVKQQQLVSTDSNTYPLSDRKEHGVGSGLKTGRGNSTLPTGGSPEVESETEKDDEFASLALDIDESIEQLNQLILDLDPEFEPVPTRARGHMNCPGSLRTNGVGHVSDQSKSNHSDRRQEQISGISNQPEFKSPDGDLSQPLRKPAIFNLSQCGDLYDGDTVDYGDFTSEADRSLWVDLNNPPSTPAFPVTPPTPYVKNACDFSLVSLSPQSSPQHLLSRTRQESRGYMNNMKHSPMSSDGDLFHAEVTSSAVSCQRGFGSMRSVNTSSPLPTTDSPIPAHSWLDSGSNTPLSHYTPQPSPPLSLSIPNAHSSPHTLTSTLDVRSLELSLLEAMEGLESVGLNGTQLPLLPQKKMGVERSLTLPFSNSELGATFSTNNGSPTTSRASPDSVSSKADNVKFVQDTSKFWYKPDISREQAVAVLKDKEPGAFIIRDSHSFRGAYGLAMKVSTPPPTVLNQSKKVGDLTNELVRHFLIECTQKGVRLKGCPNEPYFGSLTALVCQHSTTPLALPCKLIIPDRDPLEDLTDSQSQTSTNSATELLRQGAACNVWFLGSVELESLTGLQAVQKATTVILSQDPPSVSTVVHFKVSAQGITLTDNQRKLFFRRHYAVNTVIFCALDPQDRKWVRDGCLAAKVFGFIARKSGSSNENVCHLFAEHDPEQPASAIVNFVSKVMIGSQKAK